jgi:hypothetical protein
MRHVWRGVLRHGLQEIAGARLRKPDATGVLRPYVQQATLIEAIIVRARLSLAHRCRGDAQRHLGKYRGLEDSLGSDQGNAHAVEREASR